PAVAVLLLEVGADRVAAPVPDQRGRVEAERPAARLQAPADVDVVAGGPELRVVAADRVEAVAPKGRVAARDVLGHAVGQQDVHGPARRVVDAVGDPAGAGRRDVGAAHAGVRGGHEGPGEVAEPVPVGEGVVVDVGDDLAARLGETDVPRRAQAL